MVILETKGKVLPLNAMLHTHTFPPLHLTQRLNLHSEKSLVPLSLALSLALSLFYTGLPCCPLLVLEEEDRSTSTTTVTTPLSQDAPLQEVDSLQS